MKKYELEKMSVEDYGKVKMMVEQINEAISNYYNGVSCDVREWERLLDEKFWDAGHEANYILHAIDNGNGNSVVIALDDMQKHLNEIRDFTMVRDARMETQRKFFLENVRGQLQKVAYYKKLMENIIDRYLLELAE